MKDFALGAFDLCAARIKIQPPTATNEVGTNHVLTVTVEKKDPSTSYAWGTAANVLVTASLSNANGANAAFVGGNTCATNASGQCQVTIKSTSAGMTTVSASANVPVNGHSIAVSTDGQSGSSGPASKRWVNGKISVSPLNATNQVNQPHTITATVQQDDGLATGGDNVNGFGPAPNGTTVTFSLLNNTANASFVGSSTCTILGGGACSVQIVSAAPGSVTIRASASFTVGGVSLTRTTGSGGLNSADANKLYVDASIAIASSATNEVGHPHTFTVTVTKHNGGNQPVAGVKPTVSINPAPSSVTDNCATTGTNTSGQCTVVINSNSVGTFVANASVTLTVNGVSLTRDTNPATAPPAGPAGSGPATKIYVGARIYISPNDTNGIGEPHTFIVHIEKNIGAGYVPAVGVVPVVTVNPNPGTLDASSCAAGTDANGNCSVTINSNAAGTFTAHAAADINLGSMTVHRETNGQNGNSGDAVKTYIAGSLRWFKVNGANAPLGGATFQFCRTANFVSATGQFVAITPVCVTVLDNSSPDTNATAGTFQINGLVLGTYTVKETVPPPTYTGDTRVETINLTTTNPNGVISQPFVNRQAGGKIAPTQTTCQQYASSTAADLNAVLYTLKAGKINSVAPGVFFYYTKIVAPGASFTIDIVQTKNHATLPFFGVQQNNQIILYNANCTTSNLGSVSASNGQGKVIVSGATAGQVFIVSVKYTTSTVVGKPNPGTVHYNFYTQVDGSTVDQDPNGLDLKKK